MSFILWIILGGLAGWLASMMVGTDARQGWLENVVIGIVGAFIGGLIGGFLFGKGADLGTINLYGIIMAVVGAVILLLILRAIRR